MPPFEPKTDTKESGLANSGQDALGSTAAADITLRLWRQDQASGASSLNWNSESVLVYMIADLVAASYGRTAVPSSALMTANFESGNQAMVAARRIQLAILEFVACKPGDFLGAAILIHSPIQAGFSSGMAQSALRLAEPGQIILSEAVSSGLRDLPGIELRPVAALTTGGTEHAGLSELVWATPEQIAKLRESARTRPASVSSTPAMGATMMVNAPLGPGPNKTRTASANIDQPSADKRATSSRDGAFEEVLTDFQEHRSFITRTRAVIGVIAMILIGVAVALFYPSSGSKVPQKLADTPAAEKQFTPPATPEPTSPPPTTVQAIPDITPKTQAPPIRKAPKPPAQKDQGKETAKKSEEVPIQGFEGNSTYDGMTQRDIPRLLQWARSDAGNGRYEKSGQEYRVILQLQPNNLDAKEGLRKLQLAQQHDQ